MLMSTVKATPEQVKPRLRSNVHITAIAVSLLVFVAMPRIFLRTELEVTGPTDKLRFLRALDHSDYRRIGQHGFRLEDQTLVVLWDLRWTTLPETKQQEIVRIVGRAWKVVGGEDTVFRVEGEDQSVASYKDGEVHLGPPSP